jgi:hypothetical protein
MNAFTLNPGSGRLRRAAPNALAVLMAVLIVAIGWWLAERPLVRGHGPDYQRRPTSTMAAARNSASAVLAAAGIPASDSAPARAVPDYPGDAKNPSAFAVRVGGANTPAGAILLLHQIGTSAPAGTYAPLSSLGNGPYGVYAGAFTSTSEAEAYLRQLRTHGQLSETSGTVLRLPLALLIERDVAADAAAARAAALVARGFPVYALRQADGRAWLYAGAFASAAESTPLSDALRAAGLNATLAYRTGRPF